MGPNLRYRCPWCLRRGPSSRLVLDFAVGLRDASDRELPLLGGESLAFDFLGDGEMASGFRTPAYLTSPPGDDRLMVVRTVGVIEIIHLDGSTGRFLDMVELVKHDDEQGLLGLAFHPDYADLASREPVLTVPHDPEFGGHHNGGQILFGPDGYLWIAVGDGEAPQEAHIAQDTGDLRGSILRIRVHWMPLPAGYTVPLDNPFSNGPATSRPEVYMYGLRNPWRIAFDVGPDLLYIADVGENRREELNVVPRTQARRDSRHEKPSNRIHGPAKKHGRAFSTSSEGLQTAKT